MKLRQGRKVGRTLYEQIGPEPSDDDRLVGLVDSSELARVIVLAVEIAAAISEPAAATELQPNSNNDLELELETAVPATPATETAAETPCAECCPCWGGRLGADKHRIHRWCTRHVVAATDPTHTED